MLQLTVFLLFLSSALALRMRDAPLIGLSAANRIPERPSDNRIIGGDLVIPGSAPYLVSVQNQHGYHLCGGSIVHRSWILTAGSCVAGLRARNLRINSGTVNWWNQTSPVYNVAALHLHCNFDKPLYHNDIALLQLSTPIVLNTETALIEPAELDDLEEGDKLRVAGWGSKTPGETPSQFMYKTEGTYLPYDQCRAALGNTDDVDLGHACLQMLPGKGLCYGDAGSPMIDGKGRLVGLANWGVPCGLGRPDVYARASFYNDWIRTTINGCGRSDEA